MDSQDPKDVVRGILRQAIDALPRTRRSGKGWFLEHNKADVFINYIIDQFSSPAGIICINTNLAFEDVIYKALAKKKRGDQGQAEEIMKALFFDTRDTLKKIITDCFGFLKHAMYGRVIPDSILRDKFVDSIIDSIFEKNKGLTIDTTQQFLEFLILVLGRNRFLSSDQDRAGVIAKELCNRYPPK